MSHAEGIRYRFSPTFGIHPRAVAIRMFVTCKADYIERQRRGARKLATDKHRLIEAAVLLTFRVQWDGNNLRSHIQRRALLCFQQLIAQLLTDMRFTF